MSVTRDEVVNGYRYILGRYPESEKVVDKHAGDASDFEDLRNMLLTSDEFAWKYLDYLSGGIDEKDSRENRQKIKMPYYSVSCDKNIEFIYTSQDKMIGKYMLSSKAVYSEKMIDAFFELVNEYYGSRKRNGYFFDIGANIGTTSIYVKKRINPELKVIGFEPGKKNYNLFRANCIINDVEDIVPVRVGLGKDNVKGSFMYCTMNPGHSEIVVDKESTGEKVNVMKLDDFCANNKILPNMIDYIWIDTEGFESQVIEGAMGILSQNKIPLLQEFNPKSYNDWEIYKRNIKRVYNNFLDMKEYLETGAQMVYRTEYLESYREKIINLEFPQSDILYF